MGHRGGLRRRRLINGLRTKKAELGVYPSYANKKLSDAGNTKPTVAEDLGLAIDDLDGRYFVTASYTINSNGTGYTISADGCTNPGPGADAGSKKITRAMDVNGTITGSDTAACSS